MGTVLVVGAISGVVGLCGWQASAGLAGVGPVLGALSPASFIASFIQPYEHIGGSLTSLGVAQSRVALAIGAVVAAGVYAAVCYGIHSNMVRTFDMTVRKLAGNK